MKKQTKSFLSFSLIIALIATMGFSGCKKYEEGPVLTLLTKKARLTGTWELVEVNAQAADYDYEITLEKNGDFSAVVEFMSVPIEMEGTWELDDDKEKLIFTTDSDTDELIILRLTNSELWLEDDAENEMKFEKQ